MIDNASELDRLGVGIAAHQAAQPRAAISALQRAAASTTPTVAALALFYQLSVPDELGRLADSLSVYDQVVARFGKAADPVFAGLEIAGPVARPPVGRGIRLGVLGALGRSQPGFYDYAPVLISELADPAVAEQVARARINRARR